MAKEAAPSTTDPNSPPQASLLGMPAEIRNRIYHEVLVEDGYIEFYIEHLSDANVLDESFRPKNFVEPGLLRCCSQIRREARSIFFEQNVFDNIIREGRIEPHLGHWFWTQLKPHNRVIGHAGDFGYEQMVELLKAYWNGDVSEGLFQYLFDDRCDDVWPHLKISMEAFKIVRELKTTRWETIKTVLDSFFEAVKFTGDCGGHTLME